MEKYNIGDKVWVVSFMVAGSGKILSSFGKHGGNKGPIEVDIVYIEEYKNGNQYTFKIPDKNTTKRLFYLNSRYNVLERIKKYDRYSIDEIFESKEEAVDFWNSMIQTIRDKNRSSFEDLDKYYEEKLNEN